MFPRIRVSLGIAFLLALITSITAFAKGGFSFIGITGPNLKAELRLDDPALTTDFFAFANFYEDRTEAPANPGEGYEIAHYYVDGKREIVFDRLHYYPETGVVFYDGIENGESEYDGEWYTANPDIKTIFEAALAGQTAAAAAVEKNGSVTSASEPQADTAAVPSQSASTGSDSLLLIAVAVAAGLAALFVFSLGRRKASVQ